MVGGGKKKQPAGKYQLGKHQTAQFGKSSVIYFLIPLNKFGFC